MNPESDPISFCSRSLLMALLSIQGDWYLYFWLIYCKIYSAIIWLFSNHCRGADKVRSVITSGVSGQSPTGLHRVRPRRRRAPQQHRVKHIVALARRPSLRRIVMAPGASTAHTMMEDKEKILQGALATGEFIVLTFSDTCTRTLFFCIPDVWRLHATTRWSN